MVPNDLRTEDKGVALVAVVVVVVFFNNSFSKAAAFLDKSSLILVDLVWMRSSRVMLCLRLLDLVTVWTATRSSVESDEDVVSMQETVETGAFESGVSDEARVGSKTCT